MYRLLLILVLITLVESQMSWCKQKSLGCGERKDGKGSWCANNGHCGNSRGDNGGEISENRDGKSDKGDEKKDMNNGNSIEPEKEKKEDRSDFEKVSDKLIEADKEAQKHCQGRLIEEVYGEEFYAVIIDLSEIAPDNIDVILKYRVVSIQPLVDKKVAKESIVIMPEIADAVHSKWFYRDGKVILIAPYKVKIGTKVKRDCKKNILENVIDEPQANDKFNFDLRNFEF